MSRIDCRSCALALLAVTQAACSSCDAPTSASASASASASPAGETTSPSASGSVAPSTLSPGPDIEAPAGWTRERSPRGDTIFKKGTAPRAYVSMWEVDRGRDSLTTFAASYTASLKGQGYTGDFVGTLTTVSGAEAVKFVLENHGRQTCAWIANSGRSRALIVQCTAESGPACDLAAPLLASIPKLD